MELDGVRNKTFKSLENCLLSSCASSLLVLVSERANLVSLSFSVTSTSSRESFPSSSSTLPIPSFSSSPTLVCRSSRDSGDWEERATVTVPHFSGRSDVRNVEALWPPSEPYHRIWNEPRLCSFPLPSLREAQHRSLFLPWLDHRRTRRLFRCCLEWSQRCRSIHLKGSLSTLGLYGRHSYLEPSRSKHLLTVTETSARAGESFDRRGEGQGALGPGDSQEGRRPVNLPSLSHLDRMCYVPLSGYGNCLCFPVPTRSSS